jgi:hypothetical protein
LWNAFNTYRLSSYLTTLKPATRRKLQKILFNLSP